MPADAERDPRPGAGSGPAAPAHEVAPPSQSATLLLLAGLVAAALPGAWAAGALMALAVAWAAGEPRRRRRWLGGAAFALAAFLLAGDALAERRAADGERRLAATRQAWAELWRELDDAAGEAARRLGTQSPEGAESRAAFDALAAASRRRRHLTLHLVDPAGGIRAWAGSGLLHEVEAGALPPRGRAFRVSFSAASLLSVAGLDGWPGGWRVVAGRSFSVDGAPVATGGLWRGDVWRDRHLQWTVAEPERAAPPELQRVALPDTPTLYLRELPRPPGEAERGLWSPRRRLAWLVLGAWLWGFALIGLSTPTADSLSGPTLASGLGAAVASVCAAGLGGAEAAWLVGSLLAAWLAGRVPERRRGLPVAGLLGGLAVLALTGLAFASHRAAVPLDLSGDLLPGARLGVLRVSLFALAVGLLRLAARLGRARDAVAGGRSGTWAAGLGGLGLVVAAALPQHVALAVTGLVAGGAGLAVWLADQRQPRRLGVLGGLLLGATLAAGASWQLAHHFLLEERIERHLLPAVAAPTASELAALAEEVETFFRDTDLATFAFFGPAGVERQDLAYEIWRHSPLARGETLSALTILPAEGPEARFSFGLPLTEEANVDWSPARWPGGELPQWRDAVVEGEADLWWAGEPWARVRYWLIPLPGFRLASPGLEQLAAGLLRGGPAAGAGGPLGPTRYALYRADGVARVSPWKEWPLLDDRLLAGGRAIVPTPFGRAEAFARREGDETAVLFLPATAPLASLERVGTYAVSLLAALAFLALVSLPVLVTRRALRASLDEALRSYSKRLVIVYSLLLLGPLVVLNAALLRILSERIESAQRTGAVAALEAAQQVLGDYVLSLEPGFGFEAALDDELLTWLSGVIHHEINLYWRSSVYASSKPELFTAGLLPKRVPGEIYAGLTLYGREIESRVNQAAGTEYLELYAPLKVPGVPLELTRLYLSVPLLAQQEEASAEIGALRRRVLLATTLLVLLLIAVGQRLAKSFTRPIQEIVLGTQRIAAGEASLELAPRGSELATLVEAIDRMAVRIAEGRRRVLQEKRVVERVVESITSGVVSLDGEGNVLMRNRVAAELLDVEVGRPLAEALGRDPGLAPVLEFYRAAGDRTTQDTVQLGSAEERRELSLVWVPMPGSGEPSALFVVEDITEVLRGQRLAAWAEMARMIAHEIKNPLTPIRLSTEHLQRVYQTDRAHLEAVFESCTGNILRQVDELQQISQDFSTYSRIPRIEAVEGDLAATVRDIVEGYRISPPRGVRIAFSSRPDSIEARFDAKLVGRALRNLIENALRAAAEGGEVRVELGAEDGFARLVVLDDGPGVDPELLPRIFEPYFSTHDTGTGLGLPIARRIAEEHGGQISARNRPEGGLEVTLSLAV